MHYLKTLCYQKTAYKQNMPHVQNIILTQNVKFRKYRVLISLMFEVINSYVSYLLMVYVQIV